MPCGQELAYVLEEEGRPTGRWFRRSAWRPAGWKSERSGEHWHYWFTRYAEQRIRRGKQPKYRQAHHDTTPELVDDNRVLIGKQRSHSSAPIDELPVTFTCPLCHCINLLKADKLDIRYEEFL